ncbi:MAG: zf-HC2 domain-containing protein [Candidatus Aminicenantes bacterium]|nr:zf-HC2 domain-containing protein [Candidatus Aminicenantes bacterium]
MRCETIKKWLSDDLDGALSPKRKARLEAHLQECRVCRGYRADLTRLQAEAPSAADRSQEYWADFERRLESRLAFDEPDREAGRTPLLPGRKLAWAAAGFLILAAAGIYFTVIRRGGTLETAWIPYEDSLARVLQEAEADPEVENLVNRELLASITDVSPDTEEDYAVPLAADPLFWEGLSEEELEYIAVELERETGNGGPK